MTVLIVGGGPAGQAAAAQLPGARLVSRPVMAWHVEPGRLWVEDATGVRAEPFTTLLLCADEPLLLATLGCTFDVDRVVVDASGQTTIPGIFAAGRIRGAVTPAEARIQAERAAGAIRDGALPGPTISGTVGAPAERLDPVGMAGLLEQQPGPARNRAALAQCALLGPVLPARPVGLAALAGLTPQLPVPRPVQDDQGCL